MKIKISLLLLFLVALISCSDQCIRADQCFLEPETGPCYAAFQRYYYDQEDGICKEFTWGGCGGVVPFETLEECQKQCSCEE